MSRTDTLAVQCMRRIYNEMREGRYQHLDRLPPEVVIASDLDVSRTVVRDSLSILEREGFVSRKHGMGTIVNRHVLSVMTRVDLEKEFLDMIWDAGFTPSVNCYLKDELPADDFIAGCLQIASGDMVICVSRLLYADGIPAIACKDYVAKRMVKDNSYSSEDLDKPIFDFLQKFCKIDVHMDLSELRAVNADAALAELMQVPEQTALLHLMERGFNFEGQVVLYSDEHYRDDILHHTILRKKI